MSLDLNAERQQRLHFEQEAERLDRDLVFDLAALTLFLFVLLN